MKRKRMVRTQICVTKKQKVVLDKKSEIGGISISEIVRKIINEKFNLK
jgi:hypothetical protein